MKKMNITRLFIAVMGVSLLFAQCKKDETTTISVFTLSGKVSLSASVVADGAIISLSTEPLGANVIARTVADTNGMYSIMGVENGTYYINATYEALNNNNLKSAGAVVLTGEEAEVVVSGNTTQDIAMAGMVSGGNTNFKLADWSWDNTHSTIGFEFPYDAVNAVFKGHFSRAGFDVLEFNEANPTATKIRAWVDLASVETGAAIAWSESRNGPSGRDGILGCIVGYFGVDTDDADTVTGYFSNGKEYTKWPNETLAPYTDDLWGDGSTTSYEKQSSIIEATGVALFETTEVVPYGTGYKATANMTFAGKTKPVEFFFSFLEGYQKIDAETDLPTNEYVSFYGTFKFAALNDFGVNSGHLGDADVTVSISAQFNRAL